MPFTTTSKLLKNGSMLYNDCVNIMYIHAFINSESQGQPKLLCLNVDISLGDKFCCIDV